MRVNVNIRVPLARVSETDFVIPMLADVIAPAAFEESEAEESSEPSPEFLVGRVWAERLDWSLAESMGFSPVLICDAASPTWLSIYETLSNKRGDDFRKDLKLDNFVNDIIFLHEILIHPDVGDRVAVLDAVLNGFSGTDSLILMEYAQTSPHRMEDCEFRDLGFKKIARSGLLLKDNHYRYPFGDAHLGGRDVEFYGTAEHEEWLLERWDSLIFD
jgi:hypothetical protein